MHRWASMLLVGLGAAGGCAEILEFEEGQLRPGATGTASHGGAAGTGTAEAGGHANGGEGASSGGGAGVGGAGGPCTPTTCEAQGAECGELADDGCGHPLGCGGCEQPSWCGGSGTNLCGSCSCYSPGTNCPTNPCGDTKPICCVVDPWDCDLNTGECTYQTNFAGKPYYCCP